MHVVTVNQRGAARLKSGHPWVYRSDLAASQAPSGALVEVRDQLGRRLGSALYSSSSQIAIRLLTPGSLADAALPQLVRDRIAASVQFRQANTRDTDSYRVLFGEADQLPGLIVDRYNDILTLQVLTQAFDREPLRQVVVASLAEHFPYATLIERVDPHIRELEQLPPRDSQILRVPHPRPPLLPTGWDDNTVDAGHNRAPRSSPDVGLGREEQTTAPASVSESEPNQPRVPRPRPPLLPTGWDDNTVDAGHNRAPRSSPDVGLGRAQTIFTFNSVRFHFDALGGQKTGAFLDQRENYAAAARYAHGEALDCFTYQGGFALHLARVCHHVAAVDSSRPALETAEQNEQLNLGHHRSGEIEWTEANAFDLLKDYQTAGRHYDTIVLDPPAFAKSKRAVPTALRGYKELNLRALKMLRPGGVLITCSCSFHVSEAEFLDMLGSAAVDAGRRVRLLEKRGASIDHPAILNIPEMSYLKCLICQVES